jgi:hypothetical protein
VNFLFILVITVLVSDDAEKREKLGKEYNLKSYTYDQFSQTLDEGQCDAFILLHRIINTENLLLQLLKKVWIYHFIKILKRFFS